VLNFLTDCTTASGFVFEACVLEAENAPNQTAAPDTIQVGGIKTDYTVGGGIRQSVDKLTWGAGTGYNAGDLVLYNAKYYALLAGTGRVSAILPDVDPYWVESTKNTIYIRFADTLGSTWAIKPKINYATYGFFELSVQEPVAYAFRRKWKPVRGMVELLYSPIQTPADV